MSLSLRLFLAFSLVVILTVSAVVAAVRLNTANQVRAFMYRGGSGDLAGLAASLESYYANTGTWEGVQSFITMRRGHGKGFGSESSSTSSDGNVHFRLADANGKLLLDTIPSSTGGDFLRTEIENALPLKYKEETIGYLSIPKGNIYNKSDERFLVSRLNQAALTAGLIAGSASLLIAFFLANYLLRPVKELAQAAERLGNGDLAARAAIRQDDEFGALGRTFNIMAASLQKAEAGRRALTADIAHELRSPLAVQRANLEAMLDGVYAINSETIQIVLEQNLLLSRLVDDLRTLALADSGQLHLELRNANLCTTVSKIVARFEPQARSNQVAVNYQPPLLAESECMAIIDPDRFEQIIGNILSNALRYTPPGGDIEIRLVKEKSKWVLSVKDSGPGIPPEALPHVFERFYRADRSRSRAEGGSGLGLAIAQQLAENHNAILTAANHPQGGAVFTLELPLEEQKWAKG